MRLGFYLALIDGLLHRRRQNETVPQEVTGVVAAADDLAEA